MATKKAPARKKTATKRPAKATQSRKAATKKTAAKKASPGAKAPKAPANDAASASQKITARIKELGGWRGATLSRMRKLIKDADPRVVEEWKWEKPSSGGTPVWSHNGIICTGESYKSVVKLTFFRGASLLDPARLFNSSLEGNARRAIDIREGEDVDEDAFKDLIRSAVSLNLSAKNG
jgi:hypothetical protein